jgi:hypothetical protein
MSGNRGLPPTARNDRTEAALNLRKGCIISAIPSSNEWMGEKKRRIANHCPRLFRRRKQHTRSTMHFSESRGYWTLHHDHPSPGSASLFKPIFLTFVKHLTRHDGLPLPGDPAVSYYLIDRECLRWRGVICLLVSSDTEKPGSDSGDCRTIRPEQERASSAMERPRLHTAHSDVGEETGPAGYRLMLISC